MIKNWSFFALMVSGSAFWGSVGSVRGQTVERDTTITGPRGRSVQRQVEIQRGPGSIDRQVQIKRPGGTFDRQVQIQRSPAVGPLRGGPAFGPPWRPWFPRPVVVGPAVPAFGFGLLAAPMLNFSFGGGGGGGGVGTPFGGMGGAGGGPMGPGGPPPPPDQVALMTQRLQSFNPGSRKDAAYTLGRLGDPRAVPSLIHVVKYDLHKDVRIAAAIGLGEIGGSEAAIGLERCSIYDRREDVRKAAAVALERLNAKARASRSIAPQLEGSAGAPVPPPASSSPFQGYPQPGGPAPEPPGASPEAPQPPGDAPGAQPPPPPTPVTAGPGGAGNR